MKPTRRKTVLGLGALATGSGAVFSSGAFASATASSTADIGVIVEGDLVVEAGASFRDGNGDYLSDISDGEFYGDDTDSLFSGRDQGSAEQFDNGTISVDELPAARVNGGSTRQSDKDLNIQVAMPNNQENGDPLDHRFDELLQVSNEGTEPAEVGIKYSKYGEDASNEGGNIPDQKIRDAFRFLRSDGSIISPATGSADNKNSVEVGVGETKQIWLDIDLSRTGDGSTDIATEIASEAEPTESDVFSGGAYDTVDILDQVQFGDELEEGN